MIRSTLPVRSPFPNRQPSTRSAPAISPSSAVATAVPRSLCGWIGEDRAVAVREAADEPLHPVGVDVRRERLDRRRQVDDHLRGGCRAPLVRDGLADLERIVELRVVEALRRVLEDDLRARLRRELLAELRAADGELGDPVAVEPEDDAPLRLRRRVVEVHDRALGALDRLERALDQLRAGLREDRDRRVVGDEGLLDEQAAEVEVGLRGGREADLDLLHAETYEQVEEATLAGDVHRVDERLVPVAEVGGAPDRRAVDDRVRPCAVGELDGCVGAVAVKGHRHGVSPERRRTSPGGVREHGVDMWSLSSPSGEGEAGRARGSGWARAAGA